MSLRAHFKTISFTLIFLFLSWAYYYYCYANIPPGLVQYIQKVTVSAPMEDLVIARLVKMGLVQDVHNPPGPEILGLRGSRSGGGSEKRKKISSSPSSKIKNSGNKNSKESAEKEAGRIFLHSTEDSTFPPPTSILSPPSGDDVENKHKKSAMLMIEREKDTDDMISHSGRAEVKGFQKDNFQRHNSISSLSTVILTDKKTAEHEGGGVQSRVVGALSKQDKKIDQTADSADGSSEAPSTSKHNVKNNGAEKEEEKEEEKTGEEQKRIIITATPTTTQQEEIRGIKSKNDKALSVKKDIDESTSDKGVMGEEDEKAKNIKKLINSRNAGKTSDLAYKRYTSKLHMISPTFFFFDYPLGYWLCVEAGLLKHPFITANLISLIHPIFGILAGYYFIKSLSGVVLLSSPEKQPVGGSEMTSTSSSRCRTPLATNTAELLAFHSSSAHQPIISWGNDEPQQHQKPQGFLGGGSGAVILDISTSSMGEHNSFAAVSSTSGHTQAQGGPMTTATAGGGFFHPFSPIPCSPSSTIMGIPSTAMATSVSIPPLPPPSSSNQGVCHNTNYSPHGVQVNMRLVRLGCICFIIRNFLDTLDGVIARLRHLDVLVGNAAARIITERAAASGGGGKPPQQILPKRELPLQVSPTTYGFNGHSIDVATDLFGAAICGVAMAIFLVRRGSQVSRFPLVLLQKFCSINISSKKSERIFSTVIVLLGLFFAAFVGFFWEDVMMRYSNLFDLYANNNLEIFNLENHPSVRFNQWLWSMSCGDAIFHALILAMFFDKLWIVVQVFAFVGYPWLFLALNVHSAYVWYYVILANPTALRIVEEGAGQFF